MSAYIQTKSGEVVVQTAIRLPLSLREHLKDLASQGGQSLNTFIVRSLNEQYGEKPAAKK